MKRAEPSASGIRGEYETHGVAGFYKQHGDDYSNPHEGVLAELLRSSLNEWSIQPCRSLDLACGSGEVTVVLEQLGFTEIVGADPYTYEAYRRRTGRNPLKLSFEEIQAGGLEQDRFELIVCSFALHLADESRLPPPALPTRTDGSNVDCSDSAQATGNTGGLALAHGGRANARTRAGASV